MCQDRAAASAFLRFLIDWKEESGAVIDFGPTSAYSEFLITHEPVLRPLNLLAEPTKLRDPLTYSGPAPLEHFRLSLLHVILRFFLGCSSAFTLNKSPVHREKQPSKLTLALRPTGGARKPRIETWNLLAARHCTVKPLCQNH